MIRFGAILLALVTASGCVGTVDFGLGGGDDEPGNDDPFEPPDPTEPGGEVEGAQVGGRAMRRLTVREYDNTIRDVFGLADFRSGLTPDTSSKLGFDNDAALIGIDQSRALELQTVAEQVAQKAIDSALGGLPCGSKNRECAAAVIDTFGPRLFRRALTDADRQRYLETFDGLFAQSEDLALKFTLAAMLNSPYFLYRLEVGTPADDDQFVLSGEEIATELAYTFSESPPSAELLEAGRNGQLSTPEQRVAAARQLLDSPRGKAMIDHFARRWLRYDEVQAVAKDDAIVPGFANLRGDMAEETRRFIEYIFFDQKGNVGDLLRSTTTFVTPALAQHYGLPAGGAGFTQVEKPAEQGMGLLAQGSILSRYALTQLSSPPQRGAFVVRHLLCTELPPPPPNVGEPPVPEPGLTTREIYEDVHSTGEGCIGCHKVLDGIGFGFESFDTAGRWRTIEQGKPIDATGSIVGVGASADGAPFGNGAEMAAVLAGSTEVGKCVGGLLSAYAYGAEAAQKYGPPAKRDLLAKGQLGLYDYFLELAAAPHFTVRVER